MKKYALAVFAFMLVGAIFLLWQCNPPANKDAGKKEMSQEELVARGKYLVDGGVCNDCHSPKIFGADGSLSEDATVLLSGHPASSPFPAFDPAIVAPGKYYLGTADLTAWIGPWGISFAANLTPDTATGIGSWTSEIFRNALRKGKHLGMEASRPILPPMPWNYIGKLNDDDLNSIFAYLKSLKPISNKVPDPVPPGELASMAKGGVPGH